MSVPGGHARRLDHVSVLGQHLVVERCRRRPLLIPGRESPELRPQHDGLERIQPRVEADDRVHVLRRASVVAELPDGPRGPGRPSARRRRPRRRPILAGIEARRRGGADAARVGAVLCRPVRLRRVLDERAPRAPTHLCKHAHRGHLTEEVDCHDRGFGARAWPRPLPGRREDARDRHRRRPGSRRSSPPPPRSRRRSSPGRPPRHPVPRRSPSTRFEGVGPACHSHARRAPGEDGVLPLEVGDVVAEHEHGGLNDACQDRSTSSAIWACWMERSTSGTFIR